jgi:Fic family protein
MTSRLKDILNTIDRCQKEISDSGKIPTELLKKINYKFRLDWNYYSNSMEGGTLTRDETRSVMVGNIDVKGKPIKDVMEMNGHDEVVLELLKIGIGQSRISEQRIREIHTGIMYEKIMRKKLKLDIGK